MSRYIKIVNHTKHIRWDDELFDLWHDEMTGYWYFTFKDEDLAIAQGHYGGSDEQVFGRVLDQMRQNAAEAHKARVKAVEREKFINNLAGKPCTSKDFIDTTQILGGGHTR